MKTSLSFKGQYSDYAIMRIFEKYNEKWLKIDKQTIVLKESISELNFMTNYGKKKNFKRMKIGITERGDASFNLKWKSWVKRGNPAILITKQPEILVNQLVEIDNPNIIIHCTITGNGSTVMEPDVPPYKDSLDAYYYLVEKYGSDRVVLRIDPIIPVEPYLSNSYKVYNEAKLYL